MAAQCNATSFRHEAHKRTSTKAHRLTKIGFGSLTRLSRLAILVTDNKSSQAAHLTRQPKQASQTPPQTMKSSSKTMKIVPTKKYDGGSSSTRKTALRQSEKNSDPFAYYSNRENKMNSLLHCHARSPGAQDETRNNSSFDSEELQYHALQGTRKTRLSFELHPSLILMQLIEEVYDECWYNI